MSTTAAQDGGFRVKRIQTNVIAQSERRLLTWLAARLPLWVTPDRLTVLGVAGAMLVLAAQIASRHDHAYLWLASFGLVVHWFGDSLDGSLARYRRIERPIYGYFLDHTVDALCNFMIMVGFGLTLYIRMDVALFALVGYFFLCMYVFINNHLSGTMQLSFLGFGPTELRICLIAINTGMFFFGRAGFSVGGEFISYYDCVLLFAGTVFVAIYVVRMLIGIATLRDPARSGAKPAAVQSAVTNASSPSK
jgi:archaetidylinositol phosphate synthase